jgi:hypothetical protein
MKRSLGLLIATMFFAVPMLMGQNSDHVEVGAFVDYFPRGEMLSRTIQCLKMTAASALFSQNRTGTMRLKKRIIGCFT